MSVLFTLRIEQLIFQEDGALNLEKNQRAVGAQMLLFTLTSLAFLCLVFLFFGYHSDVGRYASASVLMALEIALQ